MTPADLKIRREALGLSGDDLAQACNVEPRSLRRWEAGQAPVPDFVDDVLLELEGFTDDLVETEVTNTLALIEQLTSEHGNPPAEITIPAFATDSALWAAKPHLHPFPASWFRRVCWRIGEEIPEDIDVVFFFPPPERP